MTIDAAEFIRKTGHQPYEDDLERVNCPHAGSDGHWSCGWCEYCDLPQYQCGCAVRQKSRRDSEL